MSSGTKRRKLSNGQYESSSVASPGAVIFKEDEQSSIPATKSDQRRSLFVRSLPASVTSESLAEHFSQSFPLKHATVVLNPDTKISKGFGFVTFIDAEDAQAAVDKFNNSVIDGRKIKVEIAESRNREIEEDVAGVRKETKNLKGEELRSQRQKTFEENQPPKLIVRNLPWTVKTSDDLAKLFMSYGKVKYSIVPKGKNGQLAGFGFVILRGKKNAEKALEGVNGKEIDGRTLAVDWAVDRDTWEKLQNNETNDAADQQEGVGVDAEQDVAHAQDNQPENSGSDTTASNSTDVDETDEEEAIMNGVSINDDGSATDLSSVDETATLSDDRSTTIFIRNLPFTTDDESLGDHFKEHFGAVRYARVVYDHETERSRGTGFVCFFNETDAKECVKNAPKREPAPSSSTANRSSNSNHRGRQGDTQITHSLLQNEAADPSGRYTMDGRILQVSRALPKADADKRMHEASAKRDNDRRRLYLLSEGTIPKGSKVYNTLGKVEIDMRESSARQRQRLVKTNPNLCLSLTRLSIRNVPRSLTSKDLKALAREAVVGFAQDVREGKRQSLSKEELTRGGDADRDAERERKSKGKGIVKQVKIVFESDKTGSKVGEGKGGRSRGYGFIEYYGHRNALMGLRWLNGHLVKVKNDDGERGKRLIVEFAIENAQVVQRRQDREIRLRVDGAAGDHKRKRDGNDDEVDEGDNNDSQGRNGRSKFGQKGKPNQGRTPRGNSKQSQGDKKGTKDDKSTLGGEEKNKLAMRNRIISEKRHKRKMRKSKG